MNKENWLYIAIMVLFLGIGAQGVVDSYMKNECRISAINHGFTSEDIAKVCR